MGHRDAERKAWKKLSNHRSPSLGLPDLLHFVETPGNGKGRRLPALAGVSKAV